jgi:hypothetical protein
MKLITTRAIRNVPALGLTEDGKSTIEGALNDYHVPKGTIFEIGDSKLKLCEEDLKKLRKSNSEAAETVSQLVHAKCVADGNDPKVVAAVKASIAEDETRAEDRRALSATAQNQSVANQLLALLTGLQTKKA